MILKSIIFHNWRNFLKNKFFFNPFLTIIIGENAKGKTNLLEGIYFIVNCFGFREKKEEELIFFNESKAEVEGSFILGDSQFNFKIILKKNEGGVEKNYFINKAKKKHTQYFKETPKTVIFSPKDLEIIDSSPLKRREYFNKFLSIIDPNYSYCLNNYENALKKRNKILQLEKDIKVLKEELLFWDNYLEKQAKIIQKKREDYINFLNNHSSLDNKFFLVEYLKNDFTQKKAQKLFLEEKKQKQTLIGPQRDDFRIFLLENSFKKDIHRFGSRSEQRLSLFWLKMNEIIFFENNFYTKPILLLDDIFSELDYKNQEVILKLIKKYQTVITTSNIDILKIIEVPKLIIKL